MFKKIRYTRLIFIFFISVIFDSCSIKRELVFVGENLTYIRDTVQLKEIHHHYNDMEGNPRCAWVEEIDLPIDLELREPIFKYKLKIKR